MSLFPGNQVQGQVCITRRDRLLPRPWLRILEMVSHVFCLIWTWTLQRPGAPALPHQAEECVDPVQVGGLSLPSAPNYSDWNIICLASENACIVLWVVMFNSSNCSHILCFVSLTMISSLLARFSPLFTHHVPQWGIITPMLCLALLSYY